MLHDYNYWSLTDFFVCIFGQDHSLSINVTFQISLVALDVKICQKSPQKTRILTSFLALSPMKLVLSRKMLWSISNPSKRASSGSRGAYIQTEKRLLVGFPQRTRGCMFHFWGAPIRLTLILTLGAVLSACSSPRAEHTSIRFIPQGHSCEEIAFSGLSFNVL